MYISLGTMTSRPAIYLDNAATTRVSPEVADVVLACMREEYGNPSSAHHAGIAAERRVKAAREQMLAAVGDPGGRLGEIVWTSGGTEGDALGVIGAARARAGRGRHIVISAIEHPAVRESARLLTRDGWEVTEVPVGPSGVVAADEFAAACTESTTVAALMLVNNEIGTRMPVAQAAEAIRRAHRDVHIHCDAVQALGKVPVDVGELGVDSAAFAAHKLHGPKGVGALWLRRTARLTPMWAGGGQQDGVRSGTENVPGIAGLGEAAARAVAALPEAAERFARFAATLIAAAADTGIPYRVNGDGAERAPHVISIAFDGIPAEPLLHVLESRGVLVSAGSACAERDRKPSPVLMAIQLPQSYGTVRLSFGHDTTSDDVDRAAEILIGSVRSLG